MYIINMKNKNCILCDKYLRQKKNDFDERLSCYNCYGEYKMSNRTLKALYPEKSFLELNKNKKVNFGKYKNLAFYELANKDKQYCDWIINKDITSNINLNKYLNILYK